MKRTPAFSSRDREIARPAEFPRSRQQGIPAEKRRSTATVSYY